MVLKTEIVEAFSALGLTPDATQAETTVAYKKLALQHHPDRNLGDSSAKERFQVVSNAYDLCTAHFENPAASHKVEFSRGSPFGGGGITVVRTPYGFAFMPFGGTYDSDEDEDEREEFEREAYFEFMFKEAMRGTYSSERSRRYREERAGARNRGSSFYPGGGGGGPSDQQKREEELYKKRRREFELEIEREEAAKARAAAEEARSNDRLASLRATAFTAARSGHGEKLRQLVEENELDVCAPQSLKRGKKKKDVASGTGKKGGKEKQEEQGDGVGFDTLLHAAAATCDVETVDFLLSKGADLSALSAHAFTPFHSAIIAGNTPVVAHLLKLYHSPSSTTHRKLSAIDRDRITAGCHPSRTAKDKEKRTPLQMAIKSGCREVIELLVREATVHDVERCWEGLDVGVVRPGLGGVGSAGAGDDVKGDGKGQMETDAEKAMVQMVKEVLLTKRGFVSPDVRRAAAEEAKRVAEEKKRKEEEARRVAEEKKRKEEEAKRAVEEAKKREAEVKRREAEEVKRKEAEEKRAREEAAERARREAEEQERAKREAEAQAQARKLAEERARAEALAKKQAEERAHAQAQAQAQAAAAAEAERLAEVRRREAEAAEQRAREEREQAEKERAKVEKARQDAEAKAEEEREVQRLAQLKEQERLTNEAQVETPASSSAELRNLILYPLQAQAQAKSRQEAEQRRRAEQSARDKARHAERVAQERLRKAQAKEEQEREQEREREAKREKENAVRSFIQRVAFSGASPSASVAGEDATSASADTSRAPTVMSPPTPASYIAPITPPLTPEPFQTVIMDPEELFPRVWSGSDRPPPVSASVLDSTAADAVEPKPITQAAPPSPPESRTPSHMTGPPSGARGRPFYRGGRGGGRGGFRHFNKRSDAASVISGSEAPSSPISTIDPSMPATPLSPSSPAPPSPSSKGHGRMVPKTKSVPCRYFRKGMCNRGAQCAFSHALKYAPAPVSGAAEVPAV